MRDEVEPDFVERPVEGRPLICEVVGRPILRHREAIQRDRLVSELR